jgi:hypothetical protein
MAKFKIKPMLIYPYLDAPCIERIFAVWKKTGLFSWTCINYCKSMEEAEASINTEKAADALNRIHLSTPPKYYD